ncbi:MAG: carboxypeptidase-like regulatory domain-containing protein [Chitinophaga sp.]|uniref:TonB-dependent receptor n=1 Tax=Chitinophaga sp. TaxID=1869181 RepID=UPI001B261FD7|nr:TonB-dependent receptor [Chitinophaga sp.]MBO9728561.1 carboxypeptidase-like regulatory domain-containing protein [Chitinophaga sp.]
MTRFAFNVLVIILTLAGTSVAEPVKSQGINDVRVSVTLKDVPLDQVLDALERQSGFTFAYPMEIGKLGPVSIHVQKETLAATLASLAADHRLLFKQVGNLVSVSRQQKPGRIIGKITDEKNEPLPGATIRVLQTGMVMPGGADGTYQLSLPPGTYTIEVSYVSFRSKRIAEVVVGENRATRLDVVMTPSTSNLNQVVITSKYKTESTAALYVRQKNEAGITNGISREQIAALPDKNIGETLKRISGLSTNDNRRVVVRGIAERYNLAMMDGAILPSTDVQVRDFEFDIVPSNLIDNVVVSKTATPDMSFGFGGGLVQINTLAIPENKFTTLSIGSKYIAGSTGKDFLGYGRGKNDYWGFDDGSRDHFPKDLLIFTNQNYNPTNPNAAPPAGVTPITPAMIAEQNKKIGGLERMGLRTYKAMPGQNYQFSLGRSYQLKGSRIGFVGSLSYRNEQSIDDIPHFERGSWEKLGGTAYDAETGEELEPTYAHQYNFNTSWGALFNAGWASKNHKITARNFYSRMFSNQFSRIVGFGNDIGFGKDLPAIREYDRPKFIDLLQTRINGEHTFGAFRFDWNISRNQLNNLEKDAVEAWLAPANTLNGQVYNVTPNGITNPGTGTFNRGQYKYEETNRIAEAALSYHFQVAGQKQLIKTGYQYMERHGYYNWTILPIGTLQPIGSVYPYVPVQQWGQFLEFKDPMKDLLYFPASFSQNGYEGKNVNQAVFGMMDNRFTSWLRLVWGIRAEYYKYERLKNGANDLVISTLIDQAQKNRFVDPETGKIVTPFANAETEEKTWRYLPSASLTATPIRNVNIRAAYSQSVVRPALIENSRMIRFDPAIGAYRRNEGVLSTTIDHYDFRMEWYPKPGEVISAGVFYKYFDKPVELYRIQPDASMRVYVTTQNSEWAKVHGFEFDIRKSLSFIRPEWKFLDNMFFNGNLTLQSSEVQGSSFVGVGMNPDKYGNSYEYRTKLLQREKRPLYGQVPVVYNAGLQYIGNRLGANVAYNHMGYKTFSTGMTPDIVEYERPRSQMDVQLSYRFLKHKNLDVKLNIANLMNNPYRFYINSNSTYKLLDKWKGQSLSAIPETEWSEIYEWKDGFSQKYENGYYETSADGKTKTRIGDKDTFIRKIGTSFSLTAAYSF